MQRLLLLAFWMASATAANQAWAAMATEETFIDDMVIVEGRKHVKVAVEVPALVVLRFSLHKMRVEITRQFIE